MIQPFLLQARYAASLAARRMIWGSVGGIFLLIGLGFFGVALWIALMNAYGALTAALIMGAGACGIGCLAIAFSRLPPRVVPPREAEAMANPMAGPRISAANLVSALLMGIAAGRTLRGGRNP